MADFTKNINVIIYNAQDGWVFLDLALFNCRCIFFMADSIDFFGVQMILYSPQKSGSENSNSLILQNYGRP